MDEKMVTIHIGDAVQRYPESEVKLVLANIEKVRQYYREKGVPQEMVDKAYNVRIVKEED